MSRHIAISRRFIQFQLNSFFGIRKPHVIINSIPKSGTHLVKQLLLTSQYRFVGHVGWSEENVFKSSSEINNLFVTAHIHKTDHPNANNYLLIRDPVDVAYSYMKYAINRIDHPYRNAIKECKTTEDKINRIVNGGRGIDPLSSLYQKMFIWATRNQANIISFDRIIQNPVEFCQLFNAQINENNVGIALQKTTPTFRRSKDPEELTIKRILKTGPSKFAQTYQIYYEMMERAI